MTERATAAARFGLGLAALGRPAYLTSGRGADLGGRREVAALRTRTHEMLDAAWSRGIRFVDAARSYGLAEAFLGDWLAQHPERRGELVVESKWGYEYVGGWRLDAPVHERKSHTLAQLERQWPETLAALGGAPDRYLVHSLTVDGPVLRDEALLDGLRGLAASDVRIGLSTSGPRQADAIDAARELADSPFTVVQATWNLLEPSAGAALGRAHAAGWQVVVKEALANGRLAPGGADGEAARAAAELARRDGQPVDAFAIGAVLAQDWCDTVLSGAVRPDQLDENLAARAPEAVLGELAALAEDAGRYWSERSRRAWG